MVSKPPARNRGFLQGGFPGGLARGTPSIVQRRVERRSAAGHRRGWFRRGRRRHRRGHDAHQRARHRRRPVGRRRAVQPCALRQRRWHDSLRCRQRPLRLQRQWTSGASQPPRHRRRSGFRPAGTTVSRRSGNRQIRWLDEEGALHTFVDADHPLFTSVDGRFAPASVAIGPAGKVHVADRGTNVVWQFDADRQGRRVAGNGTRGFSGDGAPSALGELADPRAVAVGRMGRSGSPTPAMGVYALSLPMAACRRWRRG
jgi:hypothetical protein